LLDKVQWSHTYVKTDKIAIISQNNRPNFPEDDVLSSLTKDQRLLKKLKKVCSIIAKVSLNFFIKEAKIDGKVAVNQIFNNLFDANVFGTLDENIKVTLIKSSRVMVVPTKKKKKKTAMQKVVHYRAPMDVRKLICLRPWEVDFITSLYQPLYAERERCIKEINAFYKKPDLYSDLFAYLDILQNVNGWIETLYVSVKKATKSRLGRIQRNPNGVYDFKKAREKVSKLANFSDWNIKENDPNFSLGQLCSFDAPALWEKVHKQRKSFWVSLSEGLTDSKVPSFALKCALEYLGANRQQLPSNNNNQRQLQEVSIYESDINQSH
jgi:hypothetical protein